MRSSLQLLALAAGAYAQTAAVYTDDNSGISFSGYQDTTGMLFGMALPETIGSDFIGQIVVPTITGYGGISLTGSMVGSLLVVAWPNADDVVASVRETRLVLLSSFSEAFANSYQAVTPLLRHIPMLASRSQP